MLFRSNITRKYPAAKVLALTQYEDKEYVIAAIKAGANGYMPKRAVGTELVTAIRTVYRGGPFLYSSAAKVLIEEYLQRAGGESCDLLTAREREIVRLVAAGYTSRKISGMLHISLKTVQGHRMKITKKLGLRNRTELIKYAMREGLLSMDT